MSPPKQEEGVKALLSDLTIPKFQFGHHGTFKPLLYDLANQGSDVCRCHSVHSLTYGWDHLGTSVAILHDSGMDYKPVQIAKGCARCRADGGGAPPAPGQVSEPAAQQLGGAAALRPATRVRRRGRLCLAPPAAGAARVYLMQETGACPLLQAPYLQQVVRLETLHHLPQAIRSMLLKLISYPRC